MTTLRDNQSVCLVMFSERGLKCSSLFSVYFRMGRLFEPTLAFEFGCHGFLQAAIFRESHFEIWLVIMFWSEAIFSNRSCFDEIYLRLID